MRQLSPQIPYLQQNILQTGQDCPNCKESFCQGSNLQKHVRIHPEEEPFDCSICKKSFSCFSNLKTHQRTHSGKTPYSCSKCGNFSQSNSLRTHMRIHTGEKPYPCPQCDQASSQSSDLKSHPRTHTGDKPFSCTACDKSFALSSSLNKHRRIHPGGKPCKCNLYNQHFAASSRHKLHLKMHLGLKKFKCNSCAKSFSTKDKIKTRIRRHKGTKPSVQKLRQKSFTPRLPRLSEDFHRAGRRKEAHADSQQSTGDKNYICNMCEKRLKRQSSLHLHLRQHTGTKNYMCDACDTTYFTASALRNHKVNKHMEVNETFLCTFCGKGFTKKANLESHITTHTGERKSRVRTKHKRVHTKAQNYLCKRCDNKFLNENPLDMHMLSMHSKTRHFPCDECGKTVEYRKCLKKHMRRHEQPIRPPLHYRAVGVVNCNKKDGEDPDPDPDPDEDETENVDEIDAEFTAPNNESDDVHTQQSNWLEKPPVDSPLQQFTCKDCGNIVTKKGELKRHVSTHDSTKKRKCTICANPL